MWPWNRPHACAECEKLRREFKELTLTVEAALDKVYHWMKRHSSRAAREDGAAPDGDSGRLPEAAPAPDGVAARSPLTREQRLARLNAKIGVR